jgi:hypothetical protein
VGKIVHLVTGADIETGSFQRIFDYIAKGRGSLGRFDEWLTFDLAQLDRVVRRQTVITRER